MAILTHITPERPAGPNLVAWHLDESADGSNWTPANAGTAGTAVKARLLPATQYVRVTWVYDGGGAEQGPAQVLR